jgi:hypothetical protein
MSDGITVTHIAGLEAMIANIEAFQDRVGAANATEALASIFIDAFQPADIVNERPFALISDMECTHESMAEGVTQSFRTEAAYQLVIEDNVPEDLRGADKFKEAGYDFRNFADAVIEGMQALAGTTSGYPRLKAIRFLEMVRANADEGDKTDYFFAAYEIRVGL